MNFSSLMSKLSILSVAGIFLLFVFAFIGVRSSYEDIEDNKKAHILFFIIIIVTVLGVITFFTKLFVLPTNTTIGSFMEAPNYNAKYYATAEHYGDMPRKKYDVIADITAYETEQGKHYYRVDYIYYADEKKIYKIDDCEPLAMSEYPKLAFDITYFDENDNEIYAEVTLTENQVEG